MKHAIRIGLLTAAAIILFQVISLFVIYRYLRLDLYLSLVAISFLIAGSFINRKRIKEEQPVLLQNNLPGLLTTKEMQVFRLLVEGKTNKEIATAHFIELSTVKTHINNIYSKLAVSNRREARLKYAEMLQKPPVT